MSTDIPASYVLTLDGREQPGLVHAVTGFLVQQRADIRELKQFDDMLGGGTSRGSHSTSRRTSIRGWTRCARR